MKPVGRQPKLPYDILKKMIDEYLNTDISLMEVGSKYGISRQQVLYWVRKAKRGELTWYQMKKEL